MIYFQLNIQDLKEFFERHVLENHLQGGRFVTATSEWEIYEHRDSGLPLP
jgi:hypothetical protein